MQSNRERQHTRDGEDDDDDDEGSCYNSEESSETLKLT
jgi:hypothetical protein